MSVKLYHGRISGWPYHPSQSKSLAKSIGPCGINDRPLTSEIWWYNPTVGEALPHIDLSDSIRWCFQSISRLSHQLWFSEYENDSVSNKVSIQLFNAVELSDSSQVWWKHPKTKWDHWCVCEIDSATIVVETPCAQRNHHVEVNGVTRWYIYHHHHVEKH